MAVGCGVAIPELPERTNLGVACVEVCTNAVVLFLIQEVAHLLLFQVTLHCRYNRKPCFNRFGDSITFSAFNRKLK